MVALGFAVLITCLFALMLAWESPAGGARALHPVGLLRWLVSGNWPAKVGAGLLLLGIGALLRYALLNIDVAPTAKLASGLGAACALAVAAFALRTQPRHHALHVALAGAALGIAYLTAYAAYGFFGYVGSVEALALLALTAAVAGVFAVTARAQSVAVLALTGAYLAPAFALTDPGVLGVYGYYVAAALLTATMVWLRGWRALIHLSFLFTLGGALFFGWTREFTQPQHYPLMQPMLLALVAIHLALPLAEAHALRAAAAGPWTVRFDRAYFALLPLAALPLTLAIAPRAEVEGALGLALLSLLWSGAGLWLLARQQPGQQRHRALAHFIVALLLLIAAALLAIDDLPVLLLALAAAVALLKFTPATAARQVRAAWLALAVGALGALHAIDFALTRGPTTLFLHAHFIERTLGAALIVLGARLAQQRGLRHAPALYALGLGAAALALATELVKLHIPQLPLYVLGALLTLQAAHAAWAWRHGSRMSVLAALHALVFAVALWAAHDLASYGHVAHTMLAQELAAPDQRADVPMLLPALVATLAVAALHALATLRGPSSDAARSIALTAVALAVLPWLGAIGRIYGPDSSAQALAFVAAVALALACGRAARTVIRSWHRGIAPVFAGLVALVLLALTTVHIERSAVAVAAELIALAALWIVARTPVAPTTADNGLPRAFAFATLIGAVLIVQAATLRAFGPAGDVLSLADLAQMRFPALLSLLWAVLGAALAGWASRQRQRGLWSLGALLLAVAALKVVLVDFSGLTQLGNIVAVIAAGLVFLAVAWLAPMPARDVDDDIARDEFARNDAASGDQARGSKVDQ